MSEGETYRRDAPGGEGFTSDEARRIGEQLGIDWEKAPFDVEQFRRAWTFELEHGTVGETTNVTNDDPVFTGKIALAHLNEFPGLLQMARKNGRTCQTRPGPLVNGSRVQTDGPLPKARHR